MTDPCAPCERVHACALAAAPSRRGSAATTGSRRRSKSPQARGGPVFCCWAVVPRHRRQARALAAARRLGNEASDRLHCAFPPRARLTGFWVPKSKIAKIDVSQETEASNIDLDRSTDNLRSNCVSQCRSPQWRRRGPGPGSVPGRTLWRGGGRLAERESKAHDAGGRMAAQGTLRLAGLGARWLGRWSLGSA